MFSIFKKKEVSLLERSAYFPDQFYTNKVVKLDDSVEYFGRNSVLNFPTTPLFVNDFVQWQNGNDQFEDILFDNSQYKLVYDVANGVYYFLEFLQSFQESGFIQQEAIEVDGRIYNQWSGQLDIRSKNQLLNIFNREISKEADEYLFCELSNDGIDYSETLWVGIIIQPSMII